MQLWQPTHSFTLLSCLAVVLVDPTYGQPPSIQGPGSIVSESSDFELLQDTGNTPKSNGEATGSADSGSDVKPPLDEPLQPAGLTLEQLQSLALQHNPSMCSAAALIQAARGRAYQVGLQANPSVGIDFQQLASGGRAEQYGISLGQKIIRSEKRNLNRSIELHEVQRLEQEYLKVRRRVLTDVNLAYIRTLRAQRQIDVTRELLEIDEQALTIAQQLFAAMEVARTDVLRAEVEVENAQVALRDAELRHIAAWRELQAVTGQPGLPSAALAGDLFAAPQSVDFDSVLAILQTQSPEMAALEAAIERARCNLRRQQIEPLPDVQIDGLLNWRDNGINGDADAGLAVSVPLPVWDKNRGAIQEARYQLTAANEDMQRLRFAFGSRLAPVFERFNSAKQRVESYRDRIMPKAEETIKLVRKTYEMGEVNFDSLLQTQRTYTQIRLAYIDALEQLRVAEAEIDGLLLSGSLN
ncbi:MAG: TolC family protein [Pirellulaceae bacterium]